MEALRNYFIGDVEPTSEELREKDEEIQRLKNYQGAILQTLERSEREKDQLRKENSTIKAEKEKLEEKVGKLQHQISSLQHHDEDAGDSGLPWVYPEATRNALCGFRNCDLLDRDGNPCTYVHTTRRERIRARGAWWFHHNQPQPGKPERGGNMSAAPTMSNFRMSVVCSQYVM